jgi:bifunctional non-homologous end joining protein LigD
MKACRCSTGCATAARTNTSSCTPYLLELDGRDLRREPIERRKGLLMRLLAKAPVGLQVNDHIAEPGDVVFRHACQLGLEGIVSKRLGSRYRSGRSPDWIKSKNPDAPAVKREAEEDWQAARWRRIT